MANSDKFTDVLVFLDVDGISMQIPLDVFGWTFRKIALQTASFPEVGSDLRVLKDNSILPGYKKWVDKKYTVKKIEYVIKASASKCEKVIHVEEVGQLEDL